jgi:hypothetical protein
MDVPAVMHGDRRAARGESQCGETARELHTD